MQHDTIIWNVISPANGGFCSFRRRLPNNPAKFCKNPFNVLGLCKPSACPLANSRYATVREHKGECYLCIKTIERAHTPSKHWEKIRLSKDYKTALKQIDEHLTWWPTFYIHKCKLRLTKMHQFLIRSRKMELEVAPKLVRIWKPYERQQKAREAKAEVAAKISNVVREELLERLHEGVYEGIYNFPLKQYNRALDETGAMKDDEYATEDEEDEQMRQIVEQHRKQKDSDSDQPQQQQHHQQRQFVADFDVHSDTEDIEDFAERETQPQMEYEYETEPGHLMEQVHSSGSRRRSGQSAKGAHGRGLSSSLSAETQELDGFFDGSDRSDAVSDKKSALRLKIERRKAARKKRGEKVAKKHRIGQKKDGDVSSSSRKSGMDSGITENEDDLRQSMQQMMQNLDMPEIEDEERPKGSKEKRKGNLKGQKRAKHQKARGAGKLKSKRERSAVMFPLR